MSIKATDEIWNRLPFIWKQKIDFEPVEFFGQTDWNCALDENSLYLITATKEQCPELLVFWVHAYAKLNYPDNQQADMLPHIGGHRVDIREIEISNFREAFDLRTSAMLREVKLIENPTSAYQIEDEWNDKLWILESETHFMLSQWQTSA